MTTDDWIEVHNETEDRQHVQICRTVQGDLHVHLCGDKEEIHGGDETTPVEPRDCEHVEVEGGYL